jgi:hypothetical protein
MGSSFFVEVAVVVVGVVVVMVVMVMVNGCVADVWDFVLFVVDDWIYASTNIPLPVILLKTKSFYVKYEMQNVKCGL